MRSLPRPLVVVLLLSLAGASCGSSGQALPSGPATTGAPAAPAGAGPLLRVELPPVEVAPGNTTLHVSVRPPEGFDASGEASSRLALGAANRDVVDIGNTEMTWNSTVPADGWPLPIRLAPGSTTLTASGTIYFCRAGEAEVCRFQPLELTLPVTVSRSSATADLELSYRLSALSSP